MKVDSATLGSLPDDKRLSGWTNHKNRLVFTHIPKCAGTTVYKSIEPLFETVITSHDESNANSDGRDKAFVSSHLPFYLLDVDSDQDWVITSFRDPVARLHSLYRFWASMKLDVAVKKAGIDDTYELVQLAHALTFSEFLQCNNPKLEPHIDNAMIRHFLRVEGAVQEDHLDAAKDIISRIDDFVFVETIEADLKYIFSRCGRAPIFIMEKANITKDLHLNNPTAYHPASELDSNSVHGDISARLTQLTHFDFALYEYAMKLNAAIRRDRRLKETQGTLRVARMRVSDVSTGIVYAFRRGISRGMLWGEWSGLADPCAWTLDTSASVRFRVSMENLAIIARPVVALNLIAFMPAGRRSNWVDLSVSGFSAVRVVFLNDGCSVDLHELSKGLYIDRTFVVSGNTCRLVLPLTENEIIFDDVTSNENCNENRSDRQFAYFEIRLTNMPKVRGDIYVEGDGRPLGVQIDKLEICDGDYPQLV
jgi:hypothetical protein